MTDPSRRLPPQQLKREEASPRSPADAGSVYRSSEWDQATKRTVIVILLIVMVLVFWISRPVLPLVVVSAIIAYLLSPVVDLVERARVPRAVITIFLFVLLLVGIILLPVFLVPILIRQLASLSFDAPSAVYGLITGFNETIINLPESVEILGIAIPVSDSVAQIQSNYQGFNFFPTVAEILTYLQQLISTATSVVGTTAFIGINVVGGIFQVVITVLIVFFLSLYMAKDAPQIRSYVASLFPQSYQPEVVDLLRRMGYIWQAFFRGQIVLSLVIGFVTWAALTAVGMPGALLLAILAGMLEVIPNLGPTIAMMPAVIIALIQGSPVLEPYGITNVGFALIIVAIYFIIQQLENNILVPRIIGSSVNLHPIIVICGVAVGFQVFGILGALLAAPIIATLRVLGSYVHAKLLGYAPFRDQTVPRRRGDGFLYRRTITGDELEAQDQTTDSAGAPEIDATLDGAEKAPAPATAEEIKAELPVGAPTAEAERAMDAGAANPNGGQEAQMEQEALKPAS